MNNSTYWQLNQQASKRKKPEGSQGVKRKTEGEIPGARAQLVSTTIGKARREPRPTGTQVPVGRGSRRAGAVENGGTVEPFYSAIANSPGFCVTLASGFLRKLAV